MKVAKRRLKAILWLIFVLTTGKVLSPASAAAADIRLFIDGGLKTIVIDGPIEAGDSKKFIDLAKKGQADVFSVSIFSPGGDFEEAMKIGRAMRALEIGSIVPMRNEAGAPVCEETTNLNAPTPKDSKNCVCASACFFIHIGGIHRSGTFMAVHRPYFAKGKFGKLPEALATKKFDELQKSAKSYMNEMGVPEHVQSDVLGTSSDKALVLDEKTVKTYFWLNIPSRHEWLRNKCSQLTAEEEAKNGRYNDRIKAAGFDAERAGLSDAEKDEVKAFKSKEDLARECSIAAVKASRLVAFKKYFGSAPTDLAYHDFSLWAGSVKYLRKSFAEIIQEGETKEEPFMNGMTTLSFPEREDGLKISFRDSEFKQKLVKTVDLFKRNTSKAFQDKVVVALEKSWGKPKSISVVNGSTEYTWDKEKDGFWAKLKKHPSAKDGPFLTLEVGAFSGLTD